MLHECIDPEYAILYIPGKQLLCCLICYQLSQHHYKSSSKLLCLIFKETQAHKAACCVFHSQQLWHMSFSLEFPAALLTVSVTLCQMGSESRPHSLWRRSPQSFSYWLVTLHKKFRADLTSVLKLNVCHVIHPPFNLQKAIAKQLAIVLRHPTMPLRLCVRRIMPTYIYLFLL